MLNAVEERKTQGATSISEVVDQLYKNMGETPQFLPFLDACNLKTQENQPRAHFGSDDRKRCTRYKLLQMVKGGEWRTSSHSHRGLAIAKETFGVFDIEDVREEPEELDSESLISPGTECNETILRIHVFNFKTTELRNSTISITFPDKSQLTGPAAIEAMPQIFPHFFQKPATE
jgi:hypothetical protein